jgi:hypothetical protein
MSGETHSDPSKNWLIFFFICFFLTVFGIGLWAKLFYNANAPVPKASGGHGGMILPADGEYAPHANIWRLS